MPPTKTILRALAPFAFHGLARAVDSLLGLLLHTSLPISYAAAVVEMVGANAGLVLREVLVWVVVGLAAWTLLASVSRSRDEPMREALGREAVGFVPLYLRPAMTILALVALAFQPSFPYGFTLPVALTQDWSIAQDAMALAVLLAQRAPVLRLPAPSARSLFLITFLAYALVTPGWARQWEGHPGNEPKYLRQGVALAHELSFDAEGVTAPMEQLEPVPLGTALPAALGVAVGETAAMARAVLQGPQAVGRDAIRASRITRQTIRGKEGGVYYVLSPGPSLILAPTLRIDRAINLARGTEGRLAVTVLAWNALGAALVAALFVLLRDATGREGLAAVLALAFAATPPFLFYFFQFYPEMVGALLLAVAFRFVAYVRPWTLRTGVAFGLLLFALPWLHQKFLPVWGVLTLTAALLALREKAGRRVLVAIVAPQALGFVLFSLYNFAITGSARPDALFLAWGPGGVTSARIGQGLLGLLFDARYGILPCAPVYLLAGAGLVFAVQERSALLWCLPSTAIYYLTVAAADNWAGAVCNLGRYVMPVLPLAVALVGVALVRVPGRKGAFALVLALFAWTGIVALLLWRDPHAANDTWVLMARSVFADPNAYVPNLFMLRFREAAPGLAFRVASWSAAALLLAWCWRRAARGEALSGPVRAGLGLLVFVLAAGFLVERYGTGRTGPRFPAEVRLSESETVFARGPAIGRDEAVVASTGEVELIVRAPVPQKARRVLVGGRGTYRWAGQSALPARASGAWIELPLESAADLEDGRGRREWLGRGTLQVEGEVVLHFREPSGNSAAMGLVHD